MCKNRGILGDEYFAAKPTKEAIENSGSSDTDLSVDKYWKYWLRIAYCYEIYGNYNCILQSDGTVFAETSDSAYCGVRPAFYLKNDTEFKRGSGTEYSPYGLQPYIDLTIEGDTVTNNSDYAGRAAVITAFYDDDGVLTSVTSDKVTFAANGETGDSHTVTAEGEGTRRIFIWTALDRMEPIYFESGEE